MLEMGGQMIRKAIGNVLRRDSWSVLYFVLIMTFLDYWRGREISVTGLLVAAFAYIAVSFAAEVLKEIRRSKTGREQR